MHLQAIVLGIIQGLTEFLPVSSSAHLVLVPFFFNWEDPGLAYDVALHMGTLLAVLAFYWKDWLEIIKQFLGKSHQPQTINWKLIVIGTIPAGVFGLLFEKQAEHAFRSPILIAINLSLFGVILYLFDRRGKKNRDLQDGSSHLTIKDALLIGCAQALAIIPGVSRSGSTITAGLALGLSRSSAMRFSFLLSAPITAGAGLMKSKYIITTLLAGGPQATSTVIGFVASLLSGVLAIRLLSALVKSRTFNGFVLYRIALSIIIIIVFIIH